MSSFAPLSPFAPFSPFTLLSSSSDRPGWLRVLAALGKVRITVAVTVTTMLGYLMARRGVDRDVWMPILGTFLLASGASALNQCQEVAIDSRMPRTRRRPIPAGEVDRTTAFFIAGLLILSGLFLLTSVGRQPMHLLVLGLAALVWYNGVYTYLKRVTAFAVVPGALIGAIPPVIGYVSGGGSIVDPPILLVAGFLLIWQIPHFWLLMILIEQQYAGAGLPTLRQTFSKPQLHRVTFMWILATAVIGIVFPAMMRGQMSLPWNVLIVLDSCWLVTVAVSVLWGARNPDDAAVFRKAFVRINLFALLFFVSLSLNALGLGM